VSKKKVRRLAAGQGQKKGPEAGGVTHEPSKAAIEPAASLPAVGWVGRFVEYLKDVKVEFGKVTWASRKDTMGLTVAVLAITSFFAAFLGLTDILLSKLIGLILY